MWLRQDLLLWVVLFVGVLSYKSYMQGRTWKIPISSTMKAWKKSFVEIEKCCDSGQDYMKIKYRYSNRKHEMWRFS